MRARLRSFFKRETVLCVAAVCAVLTMLAVPPDSAYWGYIDLRVLCLLLCLMAVVAGFQSCGAFRWLAAALLRRCGGPRRLGVTLVLLPFFTSMLVTNDVALITFVPFTLLLLEQLDCPHSAVPVLPGALETPNMAAQTIESPKKLGMYGVLFLLCLMTVFRVLPYGVLTVIVLAVLAAADRQRLRQLDVSLLATFVCFFIVSGNLGRVEAVREALQSLLSASTLATSVLTSQIISNVPAAVLLSGFTDNWRELLIGVDIGGLGTPIASLASLITLKAYLRWPGARPGRFLAVFTVGNVLGLAILWGVALLLG